MKLTKIFPTWKSYTDALCESLNTGMYGESYPEYKAVNDRIDNADFMIVNELLKAGYNPQEGLEEFSIACLNGSRYLRDMDQDRGMLQSCIDTFIQYGAKITQNMVDCLFTIQQFDDIEYEHMNVAARGIMLDVYSKHSIDISSHGDWKSVDAGYWEFIPADTDYKMQCRMYLKYSSHYLRNL